MNDVVIREIQGRTFELHPTDRSWYRGRYGTEFDVLETTGGVRRELTDRVDPINEKAATDEVLLALAEPRRQGLVAVMRAFGIVANCDYQHEDDYELLYSTAPVGRYVVIAGDQTYHWIYVSETTEDARGHIAAIVEGQQGEAYPTIPQELRDLDTGHDIPFRVRVVAELVD